MNEQPHRLAPVALLILWVKNVIALWPIFVGGLFSMFGSKMSFKELLFWLALILGSVILMLAWSILRYLRFTYLVAPDGLTIRSGVFIRKTNHIPYDRIQTVQRQQWFFLKPLGLEQVSIETAGKETRKAEGQLAAVPTVVADTINRYRQGIEPASATSTTTETTDADAATRTRVVNADPVPDAAYKINSHDLNQYALTSLGFIPIITGILWVLDKAQEYLPTAGTSKLNTPSQV